MPVMTNATEASIATKASQTDVDALIITVAANTVDIAALNTNKQNENANLDGLSGLDASPGFIYQSAAATFTKLPNNGVTTLGAAVTSYDLQIADANTAIIVVNSTNNTTIQIPVNSRIAIPVGSEFLVFNNNTGGYVAILQADALVTLIWPSAFVPTAPAGGFFKIKKIATNTWLLLDLQATGTFFTTWTGIWASAQTGNVNYSLSLNRVTLTFPSTLATQNNTAANVTAFTVLPAYLTPLESQEFLPSVKNNGTNQAAAGTVAANGVIVIYGTTGYTNFTAGTGIGGFNQFSITYLIN